MRYMNRTGKKRKKEIRDENKERYTKSRTYASRAKQ